MPYLYKQRVSSTTAEEIQGWIDSHSNIVSTKSIQPVKGSTDKEVTLQVGMSTTQQDRNWLKTRLGDPEAS